MALTRSPLQERLWEDATKLTADISHEGSDRVLDFHFNTKLAHILTGWMGLLGSSPEYVTSYMEWRTLAAEFVSVLPVEKAASSKTKEVIDPIRAARDVFGQIPEKSDRRPFAVALAMQACVRRVSGKPHEPYGINQDHLNLVELAHEKGWATKEEVRLMTRKCLGKTQTTSEALEEFEALNRAGNILYGKDKPEVTMLPSTKGVEAAVITMAGWAGSKCVYPIGWKSSPTEFAIIMVDPSDSKATSVTNMAEKVMKAALTATKEHRHPSQAVRFFEVYEDDLVSGKFDEVLQGKEGAAYWRPSDPKDAEKVLSIARDVCQAYRAKKDQSAAPVPSLAATLRQMEQKHGFDLSSTRSSEGR